MKYLIDVYNTNGGIRFQLRSKLDRNAGAPAYVYMDFEERVEIRSMRDYQALFDMHYPPHVLSAIVGILCNERGNNLGYELRFNIPERGN